MPTKTQKKDERNEEERRKTKLIYIKGNDILLPV